MNTLFLFGEPIGMLSGPPLSHAEGFLEAFQVGFNGCGMRIALGPLRIFLPNGKWLKACKKTHDFADVYVDKALEYRAKHDFAQGGATPENQRTLLYNMAQQTGDRQVLRNQIVQALMAATETTGSLVSNVIRVLATHPSIFAELRTEILAQGDGQLDFSRLGRMKYLQSVITESTYYPVLISLSEKNLLISISSTSLPSISPKQSRRLARHRSPYRWRRWHRSSIRICWH
jgi:cytochrome P450